MSTSLQAIQAWYEQQCDGDWEHQRGVRISTLDNPGWEVIVDLEATKLMGVCFEEISTERSETDWITCRVRDDRFEGFGGPKNLEEILEVFVKWSSPTTSEMPPSSLS